ncbi:MAG: glycosyltransferase family 2 protein [Vulcanimicrobiota bacterium]
MRSGPRISYVIIARDEPEDYLARTVDTLRATTGGWREIVIVDDASLQPIVYDHPEVVVLRNQPALGTSAARRAGCAVATGEVLISTDSHMTFEPGWLEEMLLHLDDQSLVCSEYCGGKSRRVFGATLNWTRQGFAFKYRRRKRIDRCVEVACVVGACYAITRKGYDHLGGFGPCFWGWGLEEHDLSIRAWLSGFRVLCATRARVLHQKSGRQPTWVANWNCRQANSEILIQTVFEDKTIEAFGQFFASPSAELAAHLESVDLPGWRRRVQSVRRRSDREFFARFGSRLPVVFDPEPRLKRHITAPGWAAREWERLQPDRSVPASAGTGKTVTFELLGIKVSLSVESPILSCELHGLLPRPHRLAQFQQPDVHLRLLQEGQAFRIDDGQRSTPWMVKAHFRTALLGHMAKAVREGQHWLLPAAVLRWHDRLILLPGNFDSGAPALAAACCLRGAQLVSDHEWVVSYSGETRALVLQAEVGGPFMVAEHTFAGPFDAVYITRLAPRGRWAPRKVAPAQAVKRVLVSMDRERRGALLMTVGRLLGRAACYRTTRGTFEDDAARLEEHLLRRVPLPADER